MIPEEEKLIIVFICPEGIYVLVKHSVPNAPFLSHSDCTKVEMSTSNRPDPWERDGFKAHSYPKRLRQSV